MNIWDLFISNIISTWFDCKQNVRIIERMGVRVDLHGCKIKRIIILEVEYEKNGVDKSEKKEIFWKQIDCFIGTFSIVLLSC